MVGPVDDFLGFLRGDFAFAPELAKQVNEDGLGCRNLGRNGQLKRRRPRSRCQSQKRVPAPCGKRLGIATGQFLEGLEGYFQTPAYTLKLRFPYYAPVYNQPPFMRRTVRDVYLADAKSENGSGQQELSLTNNTGQDDAKVIRARDAKGQSNGRGSGESQPMTGMGVD